MPEVVKVKSNSKYEDIVGYSRAVAVGDLIFVSNCAGIDYGTRYISPDAGEQAAKAIRNIEGALAAVGASLGDVVRLVTRIPDVADKDKVTEQIAKAFKGIDPAATMICTPLAAEIYKVEIEVTAMRGVAAADQKRIRIEL